jgi:ariadne-1
MQDWDERVKKIGQLDRRVSLGTKWIRENSKACPKCKQSIQRDEGCHMMVCMRCFHTFCWNCLGALKGHTHISGKCDPELAKKENLAKFVTRGSKVEEYSIAYLEQRD